MLILPGAPFFHSSNQTLWIEQVPTRELAAQWGTPLYAYSKAAIVEAVKAYQTALLGRQAHIYYALKANSNLAIVQLMGQLGCGADIVSLGELERALVAGIDPANIVFSGVGKSVAEIERALQVEIACFNVESTAELQRLNTIASAHGVRAPISLRVNPDVDAQTHPYISTGLKDNKFGIAHQDALSVYQEAANLPNLHVRGIDCHIGSQITSVAPYLNTVERILDLVETIEAKGIALPHIDFGGGLGIHYRDETPPKPDTLMSEILQHLDARGHGQRSIGFEPGRSLVGNAGVCLTEVLYLKHGADKNFCIVDAAMNDLPRPAMYQAFHHIAPIETNKGFQPQNYNVVGPVCESGDWIGHDRTLAVEQGCILAVFSAGAYCKSMASNYNTRARAAEVLVDGDKVDLIGEREDLQTLFAHEHLL